MAGPVLLKPDAFNRCKLIAAEVGMKHSTAIGAMALIWQESQTLRLTTATKSRIALWGLLDATEIEPFIAIAASDDVHFLESNSDGTFKIVGNEAEVDRIETISQLNSDKAKLRWAKRKKRVKDALDAAGMPPAYQRHAEAMPERCRDDALDHRPCAKNEAQILGTSGADAPAPSRLLTKAGIQKDSTPKGGDVWRAYEATYFARYKEPPVKGARANSLCSQLVKRLGGEDAVNVVRYFMTLNDDYFRRVFHDLAACVKDAEALRTRWRLAERGQAAQPRPAQMEETPLERLNREAWAEAEAIVAAEHAAKEGGDGASPA